MAANFHDDNNKAQLQLTESAPDQGTRVDIYLPAVSA